jgi:hypothetical protein
VTINFVQTLSMMLKQCFSCVSGQKEPNKNVCKRKIRSLVISNVMYEYVRRLYIINYRSIYYTIILLISAVKFPSSHIPNSPTKVEKRQGCNLLQTWSINSSDSKESIHITCYILNFLSQIFALKAHKNSYIYQESVIYGKWYESIP